MWLYALTIFLSAFLLFQVQPLMGKWILPWFGGGPTVWTVCLLFFQTVLLAGYAYAHLVRTWLGERGQALVHAAVIAAAALLLPIAPSAGWQPDGTGDPTWRVLGVLAVSVGLPYFALSATSPLLQAWFSVGRPGASPYRLYALSNAGSLLALASYPFVIEPALRLRSQAAVWSIGFAAFAVLCMWCGLRAWRAGRAGQPVGRGRPGGPAEAAAGWQGAARPDRKARLLWLALPACGSVLLLAVTNQVCADVGALPFLWVLPLGLYLVSFILSFHREWLYQRVVFWPLLVLGTLGVLWLLHENVEVSLLWQATGYGGALFVCCMVCHGELARLKPSPRYLTSFYLTVSAGGALGGLLVALAAPLVFDAYFELHVGLWACPALAMIAVWRERAAYWRRRRVVAVLFGVGSLAVLAAVGIGLVFDIRRQYEDAISTSRSFYGVLGVLEGDDGDDRGPYYSLCHGSILHGSQYTTEPFRGRPTTYYGEMSGVGLALVNRRPEAPMKVGVVGLGVGTLAAYGRPRDTYRFYEIDPEVRHLATTRFTYLADSAAFCEVVMGDARLSMEREAPQGYDVLALDAFTGDAVPLHLLTAEAFAIYRRHLKSDGVLAVHISNRFLDLAPVVLGLAEHFGMAAAVVDQEEDDGEEISPSTWILVTADREFLQCPEIEAAITAAEADAAAPRLWTDDYSDLFSILK